MRKLVFLFFLACSVSGVVAQEKTEQELKEEIAPKKAEIAFYSDLSGFQGEGGLG